MAKANSDPFSRKRPIPKRKPVKCLPWILVHGILENRIQTDRELRATKGMSRDGRKLEMDLLPSENDS